MSSPVASVVIPTMNAGPFFEEVLGGIAAQETDFDYEVLVIDSGSTDGTVETARRHGATVRTIDSGGFDHGATRDLGVSLSLGEYVALIVQDALPLDEYWLTAMVEDLRRDERVAGVYSRQIPNPGSSPMTRVLVNSRATASRERREQYVENPEEYPKLSPEEQWRLASFDNVSSCLRRSVWEEFPFGRAGFGEDLRWGKRAVEAGYKLVYEPRSAVLHSHERGAVYDLRRHYANQRVLFGLFGLELIPNPAMLLVNVLRSAAYLYLRLIREEKAGVVGSLRPALGHAFSSQVGTYAGAKGRRLAGVNARLYSTLDRFFSKGI